MKLRTLTLGSVAGLSLAGAWLASPTFAQDANNPPQYSTPAEKAQTDQLNAQGTDGTTASPAALNGQGGDPNQPGPQQTQYQQQQDQYQHDQQRYHAQRVQYEHNIHRYDEARFYFTDYPHAYPYRYEDERLVKLYLIADPTHQLANAPVEGPNGEWVGRIRNVETGVDGRPVHVEVALNRRVSVLVPPGALRFDADDHIVYTNLTRADLWDMPGATYESGPM